MRFLLIAAFITLLPNLALAQGQQLSAQDLAAMKNFGEVACPTQLNCSTDIQNTSTLINDANACVALYFGMRNPAGYFDPSLDSDSCLSTRASSATPVGGVIILPQCCVVHSGNNCVLHCTQTKQ